MAHSYRYCVLRYRPDPIRGEVVNIGLVIFNGDRVDVRVTRQLSKAQALSPNLSFQWTDTIQADIIDVCSETTPEGAVALLRNFAPFTCSDLGFFLAEQDDYEAKVEQTMRWMVTPPRRPSTMEGKSRLFTEIKKEFQRFNLLGREVEELRDHKVLASFNLPGDEDLQADFIFKNGIYHLTQVIDYQTTPKAAHAKIKEVSVKAIALHQAPRVLEGQTAGYALVRVPAEFESIARPHLSILHDFCRNVLRYDVEADRRKYWARIAEAAQLPANSLPI